MKKFAAMLVVSMMILGLVSVTSAATRSGAVWNVGCNGFFSEGGGFLLDSDNTGSGLETITITGMDGRGNIIFGPVAEDFFVGTTVVFNEGTRFSWTDVPQANPLMVQVVSPAGNGQAQQVVYTAEGSCPGLPDGDFTFEDALISAPVSNPDAVRAPQPGSLVVDTFRLNIRSGDGPEYTIIGQADGGSELAVLGVNAERTWWYVQIDSIRGWVNGSDDYVVVRGDLRRTPIIEARGEILPPRFFLFIRNNIYTLPTTASSVVCEVPGNQEYVINRRNTAGTWYGIEAVCNGNSVIGWINADLGALRNKGNVEIPVIE
jgi:hypothetical protein